CRPADLLKPEMDNLRKQIGALAHSEEDVLTYAMFPDIGKDFLLQRDSNSLIPEPLEAADTDACSNRAATEFNITVHGETYRVKLTGKGYPKQNTRPYYLTIDGIPEEVMMESLEEITLGGADQPAQAVSGKRPRATEPGHVTTSMPGIIVEVMVKVDDRVNAGDPILITEAMKMETEIQAPISGIIKAIHVTKGETVTPDEALIEIE
ncbi:MAG: pyruvate carboxylase subunit B, partial [Gammaproteobacteria bacterium]|nr:pyruvate carboxylase subunit B [Gammaproteobacteria bacterium]